jgi:transcriptional regulator with XRE-family HTH domain
VELAKRLAKPQSYVSKFESGERKLDLPELDEICRALGGNLETLVRRYKRELS